MNVARVQASKKSVVMISDRPNWNHDNKYERQLFGLIKKINQRFLVQIDSIQV